MATKIYFDGRQETLPGVYSRINANVKNPPIQLPYGNILIIDNGTGANYGGGSGINGSLQSGENSIYAFDNIRDFQDFTKGGLWWLLANPLFKPNKQAGNGVSTIYWAKAATTAAATLTFTPTGGGAAGGSFVINPRDEGLIANGAEDVNDNLTLGYAFTMEVGTIDDAKFVLKYWVGTFKGLAADGLAYDGVIATDTRPELLVQSVEFDNVADLYTWANESATFQKYFNITTQTTTGAGTVDSDDLTTYAGNTLALGGTETYATTDLDDVLDSVTDLYYTFVLSDDYGDDAQSSDNGKILAHITTEAKFEKFMVIGGGVDALKWNQSNGSIPTAEYYDTDRVIVVHSGIKKNSNLNGQGFREWDSIYHAAIMLGRIVGLAPQIPVTTKGIDINGLQHSLKEKEREQGLSEGVLMSFFDKDFGRINIVQGVNSLQRNDNLINNDATSFSIQLKRITSLINAELIINAKLDLLGQEDGVNKYTLSEQFVTDWVIAYLQSRTIKDTLDNLLVNFREVTVETQQDNIFVSYTIVPNTEINKILFTGTLVLN